MSKNKDFTEQLPTNDKSKCLQTFCKKSWGRILDRIKKLSIVRSMISKIVTFRAGRPLKYCVERTYLWGRDCFLCGKLFGHFVVWLGGPDRRSCFMMFLLDVEGFNVFVNRLIATYNGAMGN